MASETNFAVPMDASKLPRLRLPEQRQEGSSFLRSPSNNQESFPSIPTPGRTPRGAMCFPFKALDDSSVSTTRGAAEVRRPSKQPQDQGQWAYDPKSGPQRVNNSRRNSAARALSHECKTPSSDQRSAQEDSRAAAARPKFFLPRDSSVCTMDASGIDTLQSSFLSSPPSAARSKLLLPSALSTSGVETQQEGSPEWKRQSAAELLLYMDVVNVAKNQQQSHRRLLDNCTPVREGEAPAGAVFSPTASGQRASSKEKRHTSRDSRTSSKNHCAPSPCANTFVACDPLDLAKLDIRPGPAKPSSLDQETRPEWKKMAKILQQMSHRDYVPEADGDAPAGEADFFPPRKEKRHASKDSRVSSKSTCAPSTCASTSRTGTADLEKMNIKSPASSHATLPEDIKSPASSHATLPETPPAAQGATFSTVRRKRFQQKPSQSLPETCATALRRSTLAASVHAGGQNIVSDDVRSSPQSAHEESHVQFEDSDDQLEEGDIACPAMPSQLRRRRAAVSAEGEPLPMVQSVTHEKCITPLDEAKIFDLYHWDEVLQEAGDGGKVVVCRPKASQETHMFTRQGEDEDLSPVVEGNDFVMKMCKIEKLKKLHGVEEQFRKTQLRLLNFPPHAGVMTLHEVLEDGTYYYTVMEKADGGTLFQHLVNTYTDGVIPASAIKVVTRQLLLALGHVHRHGMLHRDIKPDNIVVRNGIATLIDFDHADPEWQRDRPEKAHSDTYVGTVSYSAPETFRGYFSEQSDLFSVGVLLYLLMTGKLPRDDTCYNLDDPSNKFWMEGVYRNLKKDSLKPSQGIDWQCDPWAGNPECMDFCQKLLNFSPQGRPTSAYAASGHEWLIDEAAR